MPHLEPTYLRYVYDGLIKGSIHPENAAELPEGLIGLYEEAFDERQPAQKRQQLLERFAIWALLKKEVSAEFVAEVLEQPVEEIQDFISTNSAWFNSPESGKYQLYHERLKVYLLQKLSEGEVHTLHEKLIAKLESSIENRTTDETEFYALEYLHDHMALPSQLGRHYDRLHNFVNQEVLWSRQIQISKGYAWSQKSVQQAIKEAARRKHEMNTIRSTVNSVKLMSKEQNSVEDILNLLHEGDYSTALKRVATWGGERQFKLYLLFIHVLTIGTSSEADFRKEACKVVLEAIDQTPEDHSVLDWCRFYPELAIYKYHEELLKMELDGMVIWKRGNYTLSDIPEWNIEIFKGFASLINDDRLKSVAYIEKSKVLMEQGKMKESLKIASEITDDSDRSIAYRNISKVLIEQGKMKESLKIASEITDEAEKSIAYSEISKVLMEQGKMKESLKIASEITDDAEKSIAYSEISKVLMEQGKMKESQEVMKESLNVASEITDDLDKSRAYIQISTGLMELGKMKESQEAMKESLKLASELDDWYKPFAYLEISKVLMEQGKMKESLKVASELDERIKHIAYGEISKVLMEQGKMKESLKVASELADYSQASAYMKISKVLMEQGKMKEFQEVIKESLKVASEITDDYDKPRAYREISKVLMEQGKTKESLKVASEITDDYDKPQAYSEISKVLMEQGKTKKSQEVMKESLKLASELADVYKPFAYMKISKALMVQGKMKESLNVASEITRKNYKSTAYLEISKVLMEQGKMKESQDAMKESLKLASEITGDYYKASAYMEISKVLMEQGKMKESQEAIKESLNVASEITDDDLKSEAYREISKELMGQGRMKESLKVASEITDGCIKPRAYSEISKVLMEQGKMKESQDAMKESLKVASEITDDLDKSTAYSEISKVLMKQGKRNEAIQISEKIKKGSARSETFIHFGKTLAFEEAQNIINTMLSEDNQSAVIEGMSERIYEQMELTEDIYPYLYKHSKYTEYLSKILFYQAKMACFFEKEHNEVKLDMLSEVLDIKDWRQISKELN